MFQFNRARYIGRVLACAAVCAGTPLLTFAAKPAPDFTVSAAQMQALGVTVRKLEQPAALATPASPARVVLPPGQDVMISAPVDGVVAQLLVGPQDRVRIGQPLLKLGSPAFGELQLKLVDAIARERLARQALQREKQLLEDGIVPARRVQEAQVALDSANAALRQAEAALRLAGGDVPALRRAAEDGRLEDNLVIRSRSDGVVSAMEIKLGQRVREADPLLRIANLREIWIEVQVPAGTSVSRGSEVRVVGREAVAIAQTVGAIVGESQTQMLRARVTRGAELLRPGEVVQARVIPSGSTVQSGWTLPLQAVTHVEDQAFVFVRSATGFVATPVTILSSSGQATQIQGAIQTGEEVAISSVIALKSAWLGKGGGE